MGYYSDVHCLVYGEPEQMLRFTTAQRLIKESALDTWKNQLVEYELDYGDKGFVVIELKLEGVKWYDEFENVKKWMQMLWEIDVANDSPHQLEKGLQYEFVRLGEERSDVETHYSNFVEGFILIRNVSDTNLPPVTSKRRFTDARTDETTEG